MATLWGGILVREFIVSSSAVLSILGVKFIDGRPFKVCSLSFPPPWQSGAWRSFRATHT